MGSFDESLKYLLHEEPADFLRFADPELEVVGPCETGLPSRGRDVDGSYFVVRDGVKMVAHIEFHRRHQRIEELAIDVAEAQIRLYRRERCEVVSHVWDLYGDDKQRLMKLRKLRVGPGSQSTYVRINLRAMKWQQLLEKCPPGLWPLVPLSRDGATEIAVKTACEAIVSHEQNTSRQADHLAILWFVAEVENVQIKLLKSYINEAQLMEKSTLWKSAIARGKAQAHAGTVYKMLTRWLGTVDTTVRDRVAAFSDPKVVEAWCDEALELNDAESARKLLEKILQTPVPPSEKSSEAA